MNRDSLFENQIFTKYRQTKTDGTEVYFRCPCLFEDTKCYANNEIEEYYVLPKEVVRIYQVPVDRLKVFVRKGSSTSSSVKNQKSKSFDVDHRKVYHHLVIIYLFNAESPLSVYTRCTPCCFHPLSNTFLKKSALIRCLAFWCRGL